MKKVNTFIIPIIRSDFLGGMLSSLYKYTEDNFYVFVIDQTTNDEAYLTYHKDTHFWIKSYRNLGFSKAMNTGIKLAQTPFVTISNDDIEFINKRWWQGILDTFAMDPDRIVAVNPNSPKEGAFGYGLTNENSSTWFPGKDTGFIRDPDDPDCVLPYISPEMNYEEKQKEYYQTEEGYDFLLNKHPHWRKDTLNDALAMWCCVFRMDMFYEHVGLLDERFYPGCFLPEENVLMHNLKYKSIKDIQKGDKVINKEGGISEVNELISKKYEGEILELSFVGTTEIIKLTPDHKIFSRKKTGKEGGKICWARNKNVIEEKSANDLQIRDLVYMPIINEEYKFIEDKEKYRIYGYFLAEGNYIKQMTKKGKKKYGLCFTFNINEKQYVKDVYSYFNKREIPCRIYDRPEKTISTIEVYSKEISEEFYNLFGEYSYGKSIHPDILCSHTDLLRELVIGYAYGDGGICREFKKNKSIKEYKQLKIKSVSKQLLIDVRNILIKLGIPSLLYIKDKPPALNRLPTHELYISQNYLNRLYGLTEENKRHDGKLYRNEIFKKDNKIFYPIKSIKRLLYKGEVYDLNLTGEHSYIVGVMSVHNSGEDYDMDGRIYSCAYPYHRDECDPEYHKRGVGTTKSWVWHHWGKSKVIHSSGEKIDLFSSRPYWNRLGELWKDGFDVWGHTTGLNGKKLPFKRDLEIFIDEI